MDAVDAGALVPGVRERMSDPSTPLGAGPSTSLGAGGPVLQHQDIVCLSSIDWQFIWQGHQEIMSALAASGNRVLFVENTGMRRPAIRDLPRVQRRLANWWRGTKGFRLERPNLFVYSPVILPFPYSRIARAINRQLLARALRRWMRAARFR